VAGARSLDANCAPRPEVENALAALDLYSLLGAGVGLLGRAQSGISWSKCKIKQTELDGMDGSGYLIYFESRYARRVSVDSTE
jgi:hypothetical protein